MNKAEWRKTGIDILSSFSKEEKEAIEQQLHQLLFSTDLWKESQTIGVTLSSPTEWDTRRIILRAWQEGKKVCVPKTVPQTKQMHFYHITDFNQAAPGHFGMEEPLPDKTERLDKKEINLLLVPGLIYNKEGYRIGFGGGYYDRFLMDYPHTTLALLHSKQLSPLIPVEKHDIRLQYLLTEKKCFSTSNS